MQICHRNLPCIFGKFSLIDAFELLIFVNQHPAELLICGDKTLWILVDIACDAICSGMLVS